MGNTISFNSPELGGAVTSSEGSNDFTFETSYAFDPSNGNAFGIPATVSVADASASEFPIIPTITVPAKGGGDPRTYTCNAFPPGVTEASLDCPGALNTDIGPGTVSLAFTGGDVNVPGYSTGYYAFSVTTLSTVNGAGEGGPAQSTVTETSTITTTVPETTSTIPGDCASGTAPGTGSGVSSRFPASTGSVRPTASASSRPSTKSTGSVRPSGSAPGSGLSSLQSSGGSGSGKLSARPTGSVLSSGSVSSSRTNSTSFVGGSGSGKPSRSLSSSGRTQTADISSSHSRQTHPYSSISGFASSGKGSYAPSGTVGGSSSSIPTVTNSNPKVSTTSTSTHVVTQTLTTVYTTYVPCSTAANTMTPSVITKTITSVKTDYTVICPATKGPSAAPTHQAGSDQSPHTTIVITSTKYICPTTPPPPCPIATAPAMVRRDPGFGGPDYALSNGETGPTITKNDGVVTTTTTTVTSTESSGTATETLPCTSSVPAVGPFGRSQIRPLQIKGRMI